MESVERQTGRRPDKLNGPPFPEALAYLWRWFHEIHAGRTVGGMGASRASYLDIAAWQMLTRNVLQPWELNAIMALGATWIGVQCEKTASLPPPPALSKPAPRQ